MYNSSIEAQTASFLGERQGSSHIRRHMWPPFNKHRALFNIALLAVVDINTAKNAIHVTPPKKKNSHPKQFFLEIQGF